jgi:hypothetical protein
MNNNQQDLKTSTKQRDFFKGLLIGACILWLLILAAAIYFYSKKDNIALFIPAFSLIVVFLPVYLRFKSLDAKIKSKKIG